MNNARKSPFAKGSAPDVAARLRHALEANETTRIVISEGLDQLATAINHHLNQVDALLQSIIDDLEARPPTQ